jgi:ABC-2 type transport system permease protein
LELVVDEEHVVGRAVASAVAGGLAARLDAGRLATAALLAEGRPPPDPADLRRIELPITLDRRGAGEELSPAATVAPGMGLLFLFFTVSALARGLLEERRLRVLDRMRAAPVSTTAILLAKALGVIAVGVVSIVTLWGATALLLDARWGDPAGVLAIVLAATLAVAGVAGVIAGLARTEQSADLLATMAAFTLGILGGSLVPLSELPEGLVRISLFTPNGWAQRGFADLSAGDAGLGDVLPEVGMLLVFAVVGLALAARLLPRRLTSR